MMPDDLIAECDDLFIQNLQAQTFALQLLARGLASKQVANITNLSVWKVSNLRRKLMPSEMKAQLTMSLSTILRNRLLRAGASLFIAIYRRLAGPKLVADIDWHLFLESYDIYVIIARSQEAYWPILPIDAAYTVVTSLRSQYFDIKTCKRHRTHFPIIPEHDRSWGCPFCQKGNGGSASDEQVEAESCARAV